MSARWGIGGRACPGADRRAAAGVRGRARGPGGGCPGRPRAARQCLRGAARDLRRSQGPVPGEPLGSRCERRLRHAARRRTDRRRRLDRRLGVLAQHVDDAPRQAHRAGRHGRAGGQRGVSDRRAPAGRHGGAGRRRRNVPGRAGGTGQPHARRVPFPGAADAYRARGTLARRPVHRRGDPRDRRGRPGRGRRGKDRSTYPHHRPGRPASRAADGLGGLGELHGVPEHVPFRPRRQRVLLHAGVPVDRARPGLGDRRRTRPARPAPGGGAG